MANTEPSGDLLAGQVEYYRRRAPVYDDWWERRGDYDRGPEFLSRWKADIARVVELLDEFAPTGAVLELAAGTGNWTQHLVRHADHVVAVDASPETLEVNRSKLGERAARVDYVVHDVFSWEPPRRFDVVFFSFWLSHVPAERFDEFWALVDRALAPGGRCFFLDNAHPDHTGLSQDRDGQGRVRVMDAVFDLDGGISFRRLPGDDREYPIVKIFWRPPELAAALERLGWDVTVGETEWAFLYGFGGRADGAFAR